MFHKATKSLAKQLDPEGDLIPVYCLLDQNNFRPLCLIQRKSKNPWWQKPRYHKTDYKLYDVLLPGKQSAQLVHRTVEDTYKHPTCQNVYYYKGHHIDFEDYTVTGKTTIAKKFPMKLPLWETRSMWEGAASICDIYDSDPFTIVDHVDGKLEGDVSVTTDLAALEVKTSASMSHARSVRVKKKHISSEVLDSLNGDSKINLNHPLIKQSEKFQRDLYVISETVETVEEAEFRESSKTEGSILAELRLKMNMKGLRDSKKAVIVPKDCILAFRVKRLLIREGLLGISIFPEDSRPTFELDVGGCLVDEEYSFEEPKRNYQLIEVEQECIPLLLLSTDLRGKFLNGFLAVIRNVDFLQELELQLEQALDEINPIKLKTHRPELQGLVENLQDSTGVIFPDIVGAVLYFLQALDELSESELLLLEESVERKIVPKQMALVHNILEDYFSDRIRKLPIDTQKEFLFNEDELDIMETMIQLSGVTTQRNGANLAVNGNADAFLTLTALYVVLYVLNLLSN